MAKDNLKRLFYRNETTFSIENYVTKMKQTLNVLDNYNITLYEDEKVRKLLDNINCPTKYLKTEVNICRSSHIYSFKKSSTYLPTVLSCLLPPTQISLELYGWIW